MIVFSLFLFFHPRSGSQKRPSPVFPPPFFFFVMDVVFFSFSPFERGLVADLVKQVCM